MLEEVIRTLNLLSTVTEGMKRCFAYGFIFLLFFLTGSCRTSRATWWQTWCIWWWTESCWFTGSKAQEATSTKATIGRFHWHWSGHAELVYAVCWSPAGRRGTEGEYRQLILKIISVLAYSELFFFMVKKIPPFNIPFIIILGIFFQYYKLFCFIFILFPDFYQNNNIVLVLLYIYVCVCTHTLMHLYKCIFTENRCKKWSTSCQRWCFSTLTSSRLRCKISNTLEVPVKTLPCPAVKSL